MDWQEFHIGFDLGVQLLNSNVFNKIEKEGKDYLFNKIIQDLIVAEVDADRQTVFNIDSYNDIRRYSSLIEPLVKIVKLDKITGDGTYDYANLPVDTTPITSGFLQVGRRYRVVTPGTTNLTSFGGGNPSTINSIFTCTVSAVASNALQVGGKYRILTIGSAVYTNAGSINNMIGTEFIATSTSAGTGGTVTVLTHAPTWSGGTSLIYEDNYNIHEFIDSYSNVDYGQGFSIGSLIKGETYKVLVGGIISDLVSFGASTTTIEVGYQFLCTISGTPTWGNSGVSLVTTKNVLNKLVKIQDIHNFLQHSYGTVVSSPISILEGGKIRVYHNGKFTVNYITVDYLRPPAKISSINNINCDLAPKFHSMIIDKTVEYAAAINNNPNYQALKNESNEKKS